MLHLQGHPRFYYLPLLRRCLPGCALCKDLGCINDTDRSWASIERALERARSAPYDGVLFPGHLLLHERRQELVRRCQQLGLQPILQLDPRLLTASQRESWTELLELGCHFNFILTQCPDPKDVAQAFASAPWVYFTWVVKKGQTYLSSLQALPDPIRQRLYFYFPFHLRSGDGNLSCRSAYQMINTLRRELPDLPIRPPLGIELWNPAIETDLCLEPLVEPMLELQTPGATPTISVIIPSYNNRTYLLNTCEHLLRQDMKRGEFEVVVVDDGSQDDSFQTLRQRFLQERGQVNFRYLYFPRSRPRQMGDARFRAGIARNLGVKHARGELVCFLDSDILTPPDFLTDLLHQHQKWDVVQCTRLHLKQEASGPFCSYHQIDAARDTYQTDRGYWENFYRTKDWQAMPFFWKYVCTYGLSMKRETFKSVGWLKRTFTYYGFEDTELGYRLARAGYSFYLNPIKTYHLFHANERSEFANLDFVRHKLLCKTARIFYLHTLESDVFYHFRGFMEHPWSDWLGLGATL